MHFLATSHVIPLGGEVEFDESITPYEEEIDSDAAKYKKEYDQKWPTGFWIQYTVLVRRWVSEKKLDHHHIRCFRFQKLAFLEWLIVIGEEIIGDFMIYYDININGDVFMYIKMISNQKKD